MTQGLALLDRAEGALSDARDALASLRALLGTPEASESTLSIPPTVALAPAPAMGGLTDPAKFYTSIRNSDQLFGGELTPEQFAGCEADLDIGAGRLPLGWMAYCMATDYHESGHTMQPVPERGGAAYLAKYDTGRLAAALGNTPEADGDGIRLAGRGKVQITGARNYKLANARMRELGVLKAGEDLWKSPDLALRMDVAAACLVVGMLEGWFTGKSLNDYIRSTGTLEQFTNARRIVNGTDRAALIAGYAMAFQTALQAGGWQ